MKPEMPWEKSVPKEGQRWEKGKKMNGNEHSEIEAMLRATKDLKHILL